MKPEGEFPFWTSTALENQQRSAPLSVPEGFVSPPLDWLRGLDMELAIEQAKLSLDGQILMQRRATGGGSGTGTGTVVLPAPTVLSLDLGTCPVVAGRFVRDRQACPGAVRSLTSCFTRHALRVTIRPAAC